MVYFCENFLFSAELFVMMNGKYRSLNDVHANIIAFYVFEYKIFSSHILFLCLRE